MRTRPAAAQPEETSPAMVTLWLLELLQKPPSGQGTVHRLRTTVRRLEVLLSTPPARVAKALKDVRKKAGKVRDIDVHLSLLEQPSAGSAAARRKSFPPESTAELQKILKARRRRFLRLLKESVADAAPLLKSKLPALAARSASGAPSAEAVHQKTAHARRQFLQWTRQQLPATPDRLHQLRIRTKQLRYSLEPFQSFEEAATLAQKFKQVQDAIGEWHDWATLAGLAQKKLPSNAQPLCVSLRTRADREYRKARRAAESARNWMTRGTSAIPVPAKPITLAVGAGSSPKLIRKAG